MFLFYIAFLIFVKNVISEPYSWQGPAIDEFLMLLVLRGGTILSAGACQNLTEYIQSGLLHLDFLPNLV